MMAANSRYNLSPWLWLGAPLGILLILWATPLLGREVWELLIPNEIGLLEIGTVVMLVPAVVMCGLIFRRRRRLPRGVGWFFLLLGLAGLYFAGEEISWGQTYFQWETPERFAEVNKQHETNLHNIYGWDILNNVPRQGMLALTVLGGIVLPLCLARRLRALRRKRRAIGWLCPDWRLVPAAAVAALSTVPEKLYDRFVKDAPGIAEWPRDSYAYMAFVDPAGEFKEFAFAMVILLFVLNTYQRVRTLARAETPIPESPPARTAGMSQ